MKKILYILIILLIVISCKEKKEDNSNLKTSKNLQETTMSNEQRKNEYISNFRKLVKRNSILLTYQEPTENEEQLLRLNGIDYWGSYRLITNTRKNSYMIFIAITNPNNYKIRTTFIEDYKALTSCSFYSEFHMDKDSFHLDEISNEFMIDRKMSTIRKNDSIYYSLNGYDYKRIPGVIGKSSTRRINYEDQVFNDNEIIPIFRGGFSIKTPKSERENSNKGKEEINQSVGKDYLIGAIIYDCGKKNEFIKIFKSKAFAEFVRFVSPNRLTQKECIKSYNEEN